MTLTHVTPHPVQAARRAGACGVRATVTHWRRAEACEGLGGARGGGVWIVRASWSNTAPSACMHHHPLMMMQHAGGASTALVAAAGASSRCSDSARSRPTPGTPAAGNRVEDAETCDGDCRGLALPSLLTAVSVATRVYHMQLCGLSQDVIKTRARTTRGCLGLLIECYAAASKP